MPGGRRPGRAQAACRLATSTASRRADRAARLGRPHAPWLAIAIGFAWFLPAGSGTSADDAVAASGASTPPARSTEPLVPPVPPARGPAPTGVRIAIVDSGVDYTLPLVRDRLARDAAGRALGIDFRTLDGRPFDRIRDRVPGRSGRGGPILRHGTAVASVLLREAPDVALVPYRYPGQDMRLMHALVEHAAAIGVRAIGLPLGSDDPAQWAAFAASARAHPELVFVASAGNDGRDLDRRPLYPAALPLDNLVTVTSADDFGRPSPESGIGRASVDWLIPAEAVEVVGFGGRRSIAAGSSYAVPRLLARLAREFARTPEASGVDVLSRLVSMHGNGLQPRAVRHGLLIDPLADTVTSVDARPLTAASSIAIAARRAGERAGAGSPPSRTVPLDLFVLDADWTVDRVRRAIAEAAAVLAPCGVRLAPRRVQRVDLAAATRLGDLEPGGAHTLFDRLGRAGPDRRPAVVFGRDTRMRDRYDAEAFGIGNTRDRAWLTGTVWLTTALATGERAEAWPLVGARDARARVTTAGLALAHELWHVFANSGAHVDRPGNLMRPVTDAANVLLDEGQCAALRDGASAQRLFDDD